MGQRGEKSVPKVIKSQPKVFIFMDSYDESGELSVKGVFGDEVQAKLAIADYVLSGKASEVRDICLVEKEVML